MLYLDYRFTVPRGKVWRVYAKLGIGFYRMPWGWHALVVARGLFTNRVQPTTGAGHGSSKRFAKAISKLPNNRRLNAQKHRTHALGAFPIARQRSPPIPTLGPFLAPCSHVQSRVQGRLRLHCIATALFCDSTVRHSRRVEVLFYFLLFHFPSFYLSLRCPGLANFSAREPNTTPGRPGTPRPFQTTQDEQHNTLRQNKYENTRQRVSN